MSNKIFNKFKEPKATEFSKKDLVVDVKNGHLYYKSDIGVHKLIETGGTGSFGHLIIDYDALPTSDPNVKGQVYRNGSNQLFISTGS